MTAPPIRPSRCWRVVDGRGRFKNWKKAAPSPYWREGDRAVLALHAPGAPRYLKREGVEAIVNGEEQVDLRAALERLAEEHGVKVVRVDSGGALNGVLLQGRAGQRGERAGAAAARSAATRPLPVPRPGTTEEREAHRHYELMSSRKLEGRHGVAALPVRTVSVLRLRVLERAGVAQLGQQDGEDLGVVDQVVDLGVLVGLVGHLVQRLPDVGVHSGLAEPVGAGLPADARSCLG